MFCETYRLGARAFSNLDQSPSFYGVVSTKRIYMKRNIEIFQARIQSKFFGVLFSKVRSSGAESQPPEAVWIFEDRLGYPANSMHFKTEIFT